MKKIFISRNLKPGSIFKTELEKSGFEVIGQSLLEFELIPFEKIPEVDWIFFYSQKGVQFFFNHIRDNDIYFDEKIKLAGFGKKTAEVIEGCGYFCEFVGDGKAKTTAPLFLEKAMGQKVLFPRAKKSMRSMQQIIDNQLVTHELVVYRNFAKKEFELPQLDILVFTSPMNARAYFEKYQYEVGQKIFSIGSTTANALKKIGIPEIHFPETPSERNLVKLILKKL